MSTQEMPLSKGRGVMGVTWLLDVVGNIWFGMTVLLLIFIYSFIGSAVMPIRQGALADWLGLEFLRFEKSEMEWFSWWPFVALVAVFCLSMVVATIRRIPLNALNAGVWTIHAGILIMAVACVYYFGSKVEGDTIIFGSLARIRVPGAPDSTLVIRPGAQTVVGSGSKRYGLQVTQVNPNYTPLSGRYKGQRAQQIWINVTSTEPARNFIRTMIVGDPEDTEDVVMGPNGAQRAVKVTGQKILDKDLQIVLDYDPVSYFYHGHDLPVRSNGAIYARPLGATEWTELRVDWLPQYYEHLSHRDELWPNADEAMPPVRPLDEPAHRGEGAGWLKGVDIRVTDYLPYGKFESRYVRDDSGSGLNPMLRFALGGDPRAQSAVLVAGDPAKSSLKLMDGFDARFVWATDAAQRADLVRQHDPRIKVRVESKKVEKEVKLGSLAGHTPVTVEGTDYTLTLKAAEGPDPMQPNGQPMILLEVAKGATSFDRVVIGGDTDGGQDLDRMHQPPADPDIKFEYVDPIVPGLLFVGGSDSNQVDVLLTSINGSMSHQQAAVGQAVNILPMVPIRIEALLASAREETRPVIIPREQRDQQRGRGQSLIRIEVNDGQRMQGRWLRFNEYPFPDAQRSQPGRVLPYSTDAVTLADGQAVELMYSRQREPLPSRVALDQFILKTYPGGDRESDFISMVRFEDKTKRDGWSDLKEIRSNQPVQHGDYWYFQAKWDPNTECHTVLGVGNRKGIHAMLAGVCISIAGMIYTFYVKPAIRRRRRALQEAESEQSTAAVVAD